MKVFVRLFLEILLLGFLVVFWLRGSTLLDADFGWHVRMGQIVLHQGIPSIDVFSYTMPSFPMIDHEWLTNVLLAIFFPALGFGGLALFFAGLSVASLLLPLSDGKGVIYFSFGNQFKGYHSMILSHRSRRDSGTRISFLSFFLCFLLSGLSIYSFVGIRPQVVTWFLFSVFVVILLQRRWQRLFWFLPILQLLWVNVHGGFAVGIFLVGLILCLMVFAKWFRVMEVTGKEIRSLLILFVLCVGVTLINPYGVRIWGEVLQQMSDNSLRTNITEWQSALYFSNFAFWIYSLFFVFLVGRYWRILIKKHFVQLGCSLLFFFLAFSSMRHIPLWLVVSFPVMRESFELLSEEVGKQKLGVERLEKGLWILLVFLVFILLPQGLAMFQTFYGYTLRTVYPVGAVHYLQLHQPKRIFALYDWNSYLLWQLPGTKIFIDGMMPSWRWNYTNPRESSYAFVEYDAILRGRISLRLEILRYAIDCVVLPVNAKSLDMMKKGYAISGLEKQVIQMGWRRVYKDGTAVVYVR